MRIPVISGIIDRRILVNYRVAPELLARLLPAPFRPKLVNGFGVAGICLIRLKQIRPRFLPLPVGIGSENAAHRIAVQWSQGEEQLEGVYISRRDTNSRINFVAGGRLFPGVHHHARFYVHEHGGNYDIALESDDGRVHVSVAAKSTDSLPPKSVFSSLDAASNFFATGSVGYSPIGRSHRHDGIELRCTNWEMTPLDVTKVESSFFDDRKTFPAGSAVFDCALLMRRIRHEWHGRDEICCESAQ
jgi:hypothetical protein